MLRLKLREASEGRALAPLYELARSRGFKQEVKSKFHLLILYLAALASAEISSKDLFKFIGRMRDALGAIAQVFRRLDLLVNKWGYNQVEACKLVAKALPKCELKELLFRLSQAIGVGLPVKDFAAIEYSKFLVAFQDEYERAMDRLRRLSEAYSAMLTASAFISVAMMLVSMIYGASSPTSMLTLTAMMVAATIVFMLYLMSRTAPRGRVVALSDVSPRGLRLVEGAAMPLTVASSVAAASFSMLMIAGVVRPPPITFSALLSRCLPIPLPLMVAGLPLVAIGIKGKRALEEVKMIDAYYPVFIKTLGDAAAVSGSVNEAVRAVVYNDYGPLTPLVRRLHKRLKMGVKTEVSWRLFERESGSDLVSQGTEVFFNAVRSGGKAKEAALAIFDFTSLVLNLRKKRAQVAGFLKGLVFPLQATLISVLTLMRALMAVFFEFSKLVSSYVSFIGYVEEGLMLAFLLFVALTLTLGNTIALYVVEGEARSLMAYYGGMMMLIAGAVMWAVDGLTSSIFSMLARFTTEVGGVAP
ncbi:hypothetical protein B6U99_07260 [Candidatus Geothermarchaeota archaeon ex4572_27]|nr:MAG: hypothetical protein B6U99_07260 [Candidatus Geothermarchaeota archaeon ex4572_27]